MMKVLVPRTYHFTQNTPTKETTARRKEIQENQELPVFMLKGTAFIFLFLL